MLAYKEHDDIEWFDIDRQPNVRHGYNKDRKCKVIKIGVTLPEQPSGYISLKQESKKNPVEFDMHSFNRNYYNRLTDQLMGVATSVLGITGGAGYLNMRKTDGLWEDGIYPYIPIGAGAAESITSDVCWSSLLGETGHGITIGSGSGAFSFENYSLTHYTHGQSAGNIWHTVNSPFVIAYDAGSRVWSVNHSRFFINFSGATISTISELGLITYLISRHFLEERSVLASAITLLNKESLRVRYERLYTFPNTVDWTRNLYNLWLCNTCYCGMPSSTFGAGLRSVKTTAGTVAYHANSLDATYHMDTARCYNAGSGVSDFGIQVGTGNTAESLEDYALATPVAHAASFTYAASSRLSTTYSAGTKTYTTQWSRQVDNVSKGSTTINEIGLVNRLYLYSVNYDCLIARKVLASPVTMANGESLQTIYEISSVFPS